MERELFFHHCNFMDITLDKTNDCLAELRAVVPAGDVKEKKNSILAAYCRNARVPGFRPGKAPASVIARHFAKEVTEQLHDDLRSAAQSAVLEQNPALKVLDFGALSLTEEADGSCTITSSLTLVPQFELPEYMGLEVSVPNTDVTDEEVEKTMLRYAETSATFEPVERAAAKGDIVVMDFKTSVEGKPAAEYCGRSVGFMEGREDYHFAIGDDTFIPGLGEGLVGASAGDSRQVPCTLQEDFPFTELAGKEVLFDCTVKEVQEKRVPELTVELFKGVLPGETLDEIREGVRKHLQDAIVRNNEELKADQISDKLADQLSFSLPEDLVERENENTVQRKIYAAFQEGKYNVSKELDTLRAEAKVETERNLRVYFALLEIAEREHITATDQEVMNSITHMAEQAREKNLKAFVRKLQSENRITGIRLSIVTSKVIDLLVRNAKVTVEEPKKPEPEQTPEA